MFGKAFGVVAAIWIFVIVCWIGNVVKLADCDFEAPYRCEFVHGVGLLGPVAVGTVWFDTDAE